METEKISIIVPVYNVEKYLSRCIDSVLSQKYHNLEIILVDDGSVDSSGKICDEYQQKDHRFTVIHKKNGGLSSARNSALDIVSGSYITFIDSDDWVSPEYITDLYELIIKFDADIAVCDENRFIENNGKIYYQGSPYKKISREVVQTPEEALDTYMKQILYDASACMKMYKRELFDNVRYPEGCVFEDIGTTYKLFCKAKRVAFTPKQMYYYFQRNGSILHSYNTDELIKNLKDGISMTEAQKKFVINVFPKLSDAADSRCFSMYCRAVGLSIITHDKDISEYSWCQIKKLREKFIKGNYRRKVKLASILSYLGKHFFIICYSKLTKN